MNERLEEQKELVGSSEEVRGFSDVRLAPEPGIVTGTNNQRRVLAEGQTLAPREIYIPPVEEGEEEQEELSNVHNFRGFEVSKLNYGYIVKVGCHKFAIESDASLIKHLTEYIKNPGEKEKKWWDSKSTQI